MFSTWLNKNKLIVTVSAVVVAVGIYVVLPVRYHLGYKAPTAQQQVVNEVTFQGIDGQNALQVLETTHKVDVKHYSFGDFVTGIDGNTPDTSHTWSFYVNGKLSDVGASSYMTKSSDVLMFRVEAIQ